MGSAVRGRDGGDDGERIGGGTTSLVRCWHAGVHSCAEAEAEADIATETETAARPAPLSGEKGREGERRGEKGVPPTARCPLSHTTAESTTPSTPFIPRALHAIPFIRVHYARPR